MNVTHPVKRLVVATAALSTLVGATGALAKTRPVLTAGAVASPDRYGALAAAEVLREGGNAVDAASPPASPWP